MKDLDDLFNQLKNVVGHGKHEKIVKTIPLPEGYKKRWTEIKKLGDKIEEDMNRHDAMRRAFWGSLELEISEYRHMHVDDTKWELEVYGEEDEKGKIVSPIQIKR